VSNLSQDSYIKAGEKYFKPAAPTKSDEMKITREKITRKEFDEFLKYEAGCGRRDYGACKKTREPDECETCKKAVKLELDGNGAGAAKLFSKCPAKIKKPCSNCAPGTDAFTHTIAAINSGLRKLAKVTPLAPTAGVKWEEVGSQYTIEHGRKVEQKPPRGIEIVNKALADALAPPDAQAKNKLEFSLRELDDLKVYHLSQDSYIKAGEKYFKPAEPTGVLYRGINGMSYEGRLLEFGEPELLEHLSADAFRDTCRGFVDYSFASATPSKHVALTYSGALDCKGNKCECWNVEKGFCEKHRSTVLEIQTGQIDRGSELGWISQFPKEVEHCLLPLSNFEVQGMRREKAASGGEYNVLEIKLNVNLNAQTLEQLRESRKTTAVEIARGLLQESEQLLSGNAIIQMDKVSANECLCVCVCVSVFVYIHTHIHTYVCMHAYYVCMHACMRASMRACMHVCLHVCMYACMYACMHVYLHVCMYVCMHVCMYVCMYVCKYV